MKTDDPFRAPRNFSWWDRQDWKPQPPAGKEFHRLGHHGDLSDDLPQGDKKWRLNNPKKRDSRDL